MLIQKRSRGDVNKWKNTTWPLSLRFAFQSRGLTWPWDKLQLCPHWWKAQTPFHFPFQMHPKRMCQRTLTSTWTTQRLKRQPSPSSPSSESSRRRRSAMKSPSEHHVALSLCARTAGGSDGTAMTVWHLHVKQIHTSWNSKGCDGAGGGVGGGMQ